MRHQSSYFQNPGRDRGAGLAVGVSGFSFGFAGMSSMMVGLRLQPDGKSDAFVSAGNTGAQMAASMLLLRNGNELKG